MSSYQRFTTPLLLALTTIVLLGISFPLQVYAPNGGEFGSGFLELLGYLTPWLSLAVAIFGLLAVVTPQLLRRWISLGWIALLLCTYVQGSLLLWDYGVFDGQKIPWDAFASRSSIDIIVWSGIVGACVVFRRILFTAIPRLALALLVIASVQSVLSLFRYDVKWIRPPFQVQPEEMLTFSEERNVVAILLDSFQTELFEEILAQDPTATAALRDFTFYSNASGLFPTTAASIPAILSGYTYDNSLPFSHYTRESFAPNSLPRLIAAHGYEATLISLPQLCPHASGFRCTFLGQLVNADAARLAREEAAKLADVSLFRLSPQILKERIYSDDAWFLQAQLRDPRLRRLPVTHADSLRFVDLFEKAARVGASRPTFHFLHLFIPHAPQRLSSQCELFPPGAKIEAGRRYRAQGRCALRLAERILDTLRRLAIYEKSAVMILADHGSGYGKSSRRGREGFPDAGGAMPLLLFKDFGASQSAMRTSNAPVSLGDVTQTLLSVAGSESNVPGEDIRVIPETASRTRVYRLYRWAQKYWYADSMPPMTEYEISGPVRDIDTWRKVRALPSWAESAEGK